MEHTSKHPIDDELLSAYIDGAVSAEEKARIEAAMAVDPQIAWQVDTLRQTVDLLRSLPKVALPRSFVLTEAQVSDVLGERRAAIGAVSGREDRPRTGFWQDLLAFLNSGNLLLRNATALAALLLVVLTAADVSFGPAPRGEVVSRAQPSAVAILPPTSAALPPTAAPQPPAEAPVATPENATAAEAAAGEAAAVTAPAIPENDNNPGNVAPAAEPAVPFAIEGAGAPSAAAPAAQARQFGAPKQGTALPRSAPVTPLVRTLDANALQAESMAETPGAEEAARGEVTAAEAPGEEVEAVVDETPMPTLPPQAAAGAPAPTEIAAVAPASAPPAAVEAEPAPTEPVQSYFDWTVAQIALLVLTLVLGGLWLASRRRTDAA